MAYLGNRPTAIPLTGADLTDGIITSAKIADGTIASADLASGVGGKFLQVVQTSITSTTSVTTTSFVDVGLSLAITPFSTSSKILVISTICGGSPQPSASGDEAYVALARDIGGAGYNTIGGGGNIELSSFFHISGGENSAYNDVKWMLHHGTIHYLDSPSTVSECTYKIQQRNRNASKQTYFNRRGGDTMSGISYLTLMEIAG